LQNFENSLYPKVQTMCKELLSKSTLVLEAHTVAF